MGVTVGGGLRDFAATTRVAFSQILLLGGCEMSVASVPFALHYIENEVKSAISCRLSSCGYVSREFESRRSKHSFNGLPRVALSALRSSGKQAEPLWLDRLARRSTDRWTIDPANTRVQQKVAKAELPAAA